MKKYLLAISLIEGKSKNKFKDELEFYLHPEGHLKINVNDIEVKVINRPWYVFKCHRRSSQLCIDNVTSVW